MHPAPSLIAFSLLSGLGFGLLAMLGLGIAAPEGLVGTVFWGLGLGLSGSALLASAFHLGHPERALKAFSQWRSSWLSREAWLASAAMAVFALHAGLITFAGWRIAPLGWLGALLALGTVGATAMIYAQLRTVPRWHHWSTPALFIGHALAGGSLLAGKTVLAGILLIALGAGQLAAWWLGDRLFARSGTSITRATGLGVPDGIRLWEAPHTGQNYLTREMVFVIARKHVAKLRVIAAVFGYAAPAVLLLLPSVDHAIAAVAVLCHIFGAAVSRWLFFAEAEHVVGLYYGRGR
ncbi:dimethyl sulfoxide reductase anchor subunit family protein [Profundibacterium mesophilum]|uniref:Dimethylsulfoxide reductase n=1 Tax=Profundibacterium mesophilum KAUST100406-0324 TaxID=1037889 RepID=A0A921NQC3_9RHOB|nr:DmsC/YnfH family molybdoenzyme membrane anchor subunit [Profundibacterium mesophilum]KAF0676821.1 putative dimethylsulfoxide reductase [Profundibacterium mesophilum KAUST100406-0324]